MSWYWDSKDKNDAQDPQRQSWLRGLKSREPTQLAYFLGPTTLMRFRLKTHTLWCVFAFRTHYNAQKRWWKRKLLKTVSKVECFENAPFIVWTVQKRQILSLPSAFSGVLVYTDRRKHIKKYPFRMETHQCGQVKTKRKRGENIFLRFMWLRRKRIRINVAWASDKQDLPILFSAFFSVLKRFKVPYISELLSLHQNVVKTPQFLPNEDVYGSYRIPPWACPDLETSSTPRIWRFRCEGICAG